MRRLVVALLALLALLVPRVAHADGGAPSQHKPRWRICCPFATQVPLHLGATHVPITIGLVASAERLGAHSYSGEGLIHESNGLVYTRRGGFIDTGHLRDYADLTAYLAMKLEPLVARGEGTFALPPLGGEIRVSVLAPARGAVPAASARLAQRIAYLVSIWAEILQYYGHSPSRGVDEIYSAFTPEDVYSNLLGTYVGAAAVASSLPYDDAVDAILQGHLKVLGALSSEETRAILERLDGVWWHRATAWPSPNLVIKRSFEIGPRVGPVLAPGAPAADPLTLEAPVSEIEHRFEIVPARAEIPRFADARAPAVITSEDVPVLVDGVRRSADGLDPAALDKSPDDAHERGGPLAHYLHGIRFVDIEGRGGFETNPSGGSLGAGGGSLVGVLGDTRGGDFAALRFDVNHTRERGVIAGFSLYRSDAVYFCHDAETKKLRAPLVSLLGPCAPGEWLGLGATIAEAFHDGRTGRTAIRPIGVYGVLNVLGNGQSPSYDGLRVLLRGGASFEHVWTEVERATSIPRTGGGVVIVTRTPKRWFEARGMATYRIDPSATHDVAFESRVGLRWYFLLGGRDAAGRADGIDPWGVGSLGLESGYSHFTRPLHAFPDGGLPLVATDRQGTWQLLLTATLGFEGLTF